MPDPREELAALAAALSAHARRSAWRGRRKSPLPPAPQGSPATGPAAGAPPTGFLGTAARTSAGPAEPPRAPTPVTVPPSPAMARGETAAKVPAGLPGGAPAPALAPAEAPGRRVSRLALEAAEIQARDIRARAQACGDLASLRAAVSNCTACSLCRTRTQTVFMDGTGKVPVMFVGEAPGANEDLQGVPFVGRAGALLTDIITKGMGLAREDVVIANVLKCRPPDNRDPSDVEKILCTPWLDRQIELIGPRVLIPLGGHAAKHLLRSDSNLGGLRGRVHERDGRKVVPTFHPAYLLRSPSEKSECWKDIQLAMGELGISRKPPSGGPSAPSPRA